MIVATLPYPPTVNHYWVLARGRIHISTEGRAYRRRVRAILKDAPKAEGPVAVAILVHPPDQRKRDLDNLLKCLLDSLTAAGVWDDDSQVCELAMRRGDLEPGGYVQISVAAIPQK